MIASPLLFLRHGETDWNTAGRYQGSTDTSLSDAGKLRGAQHACLVRQLCADSKLDRKRLSITTSPLQRASGTADWLQSELDPPPVISIEPRLRELSFGRWEGLTSMEVKARFYEERKRRKIDRYAFAPKGGDSMAARHAGVSAALAARKPHTIVVTHSGIIRLIALILNDDDSAVSMAVPHEGGFLWNGERLNPVVM